MSLLVADRAANLGIWVAVAVVVLGWLVVTATSRQLPSLAAVLRFARRWWIARWALLAGWAWLGWHLFVRTHY